MRGSHGSSAPCKKTKHANLLSWRLGASDSIVDVDGAPDDLLPDLQSRFSCIGLGGAVNVETLTRPRGYDWNDWSIVSDNHHQAPAPNPTSAFLYHCE